MKNEFLQKLDEAFVLATAEDIKAFQNVLVRVRSFDDLALYIRVLAYLAARGPGEYDLDVMTKDMKRPLSKPSEAREFMPSRNDIDFAIYHLGKDGILRITQPHSSRAGKYSVETFPLFETYHFTTK